MLPRKQKHRQAPLCPPHLAPGRPQGSGAGVRQPAAPLPHCCSRSVPTPARVGRSRRQQHSPAPYLVCQRVTTAPPHTCRLGGEHEPAGQPPSAGRPQVTAGAAWPKGLSGRTALRAHPPATFPEPERPAPTLPSHLVSQGGAHPTQGTPLEGLGFLRSVGL